MAYIQNNDQEDQDSMNVLEGQSAQGQQQESQQAPAPATTGTAQSANIQPTQQQSPAKPQGSGMFTDVSKYIKANQPQAQKMGQAVVGGLQSKAADIGKKIEEKMGKYGTQVGAVKGKIGSESEWAKQQMSEAGKLTPGQAQTPGFVSPMETDVERFQRILNERNTYSSQVTTPQVEQEKARMQAIQSLAQSTRRPGQEGQLLSETFAPKADYSRGMLNLDKALLQMSRGAREELLRGGTQLGEGIQSTLKQQQQSAEQQANELKIAEEAMRSGIQTQLGTERETIDKSVAQKVAEARTKGQEEFGKFKDALARGQDVSADQLARFTGDPLAAQALEKYQKYQPLTIAEKLAKNEGYTEGDYSALAQASGKSAQEMKDATNALRFNEAQQRRNMAVREQFVDDELADRVRKLYESQGRNIDEAIAQTGTGNNEVWFPGSIRNLPEWEQVTNQVSREIMADRAKLPQSIAAKQQASEMFSKLQSTGPKDILSKRTGKSILDASQFLGQYDPNRITASKAASQEEIARAAALAKLAGGASQYGEDISLGGTALNRIADLDVGSLLERYKRLEENPTQYIAPGATAEVRDKSLLEKIAKSPVAWAASPGVGATAAAVRVVKKLFCHLSGTLLKMFDGSIKKIEEIVPGDILELGGRVSFAMPTLSTSAIYEYNGNFVAKDHEVFEDGEWKLIQNSRNAVLTDIYNPVVHPIICENHKYMTQDGTIWADLVGGKELTATTIEEYLNQVEIGE